MPYKDIPKNRTWHRNHMRMIRLKQPAIKKGTDSDYFFDYPIVESDNVTPVVTPKVDADGNRIYDE